MAASGRMQYDYKQTNVKEGNLWIFQDAPAIENRWLVVVSPRIEVMVFALAIILIGPFPCHSPWLEERKQKFCISRIHWRVCCV
jgi:hypothetical protein